MAETKYTVRTTLLSATSADEFGPRRIARLNALLRGKRDLGIVATTARRDIRRLERTGSKRALSERELLTLLAARQALGVVLVERRRRRDNKKRGRRSSGNHVESIRVELQRKGYECNGRPVGRGVVPTLVKDLQANHFKRTKAVVTTDSVRRALGLKQ